MKTLLRRATAVLSTVYTVIKKSYGGERSQILIFKKHCSLLLTSSVKHAYIMTSHEAMMVVNDDEEEGSILVRKLRDPPLHSMVFDNTFLLEEIISYINKAPIHLMVLQKTCKHYHSNNILQRAIMSIFRSNLDHLVSRAGYAELSKQTDPEGGYTSVLKPKKCVLSGSIVLQAILGEVWPGSDIDMYTVASDALRVRHKLYRKMGYLSPVRPWGTEPHTDELGALNVYLIAIPGSVLESVEIWTSPKPKADDVQAAADLLNTARIDGTLRFHKSSRSAGMLQMMVRPSIPHHFVFTYLITQSLTHYLGM